ncbi:MAG: type IV pilus twitching motility protein PilT [Lachnospirales bacterium]
MEDVTIFLEKILKNSREKNATDIHLCTGSNPIFRVNGKLVKSDDVEKLTLAAMNEIVGYITPLNRMDILQTNRVLDFSFSQYGIGRFRCNIYSQRGTFAIALRVLPFDIPEFETLGLPPSIKNISTANKGLFLTTGATGSGKSTTMASLVNLINDRQNYHIITIEDPIEYVHKHKEAYITQREIGADALSFSDALRSSLREDPDVIMVGEMRDTETISIALTAAETGHLVLSTLHTVGATKSIDRIIDAFPGEQQEQVRSQLATVLQGVISQQLVPRADGKGVALATEVMYTNPAIKNLIREGKQFQINSIMQTGQNVGMHLMEDSLAKLVKAGIITQDEAEAKTTDHQLLKQFLARR